MILRVYLQADFFSDPCETVHEIWSLHNSKIVLYGYYVGTIRAKQGLNTKEFSALFYDFPQGHGDEMSIKEMKEDIINAILNV